MHAQITVTLFCAFFVSGTEEIAAGNNGASFVGSLLDMTESRHCAILGNRNQCVARRNWALSIGKLYFPVEAC
jgi:hypothetical protein